MRRALSIMAAMAGTLLAVCVAEQASARTVRAVAGKGELEIAGRKMSCGGVVAQLDAELPNLGIAIPGRRLLLINPALVAEQPGVVQWFVFPHECGYHRVGASEMSADCWATDRGVAEGWLDREGLEYVCRSFGDGPATTSHPSGNSRCVNLERCFATALDRHKHARRPANVAATPKPGTTTAVETGPRAGSSQAYWPVRDSDRRSADGPTARETPLP